MTAIISRYNSIYYPVKITWDKGNKSIVVESEYYALEYIKAFLPLNTKIINRLEK